MNFKQISCSESQGECSFVLSMASGVKSFPEEAMAKDMFYGEWAVYTARSSISMCYLSGLGQRPNSYCTMKETQTSEIAAHILGLRISSCFRFYLIYLGTVFTEIKYLVLWNRYRANSRVGPIQLNFHRVDWLYPLLCSDVNYFLIGQEQKQGM